MSPSKLSSFCVSSFTSSFSPSPLTRLLSHTSFFTHLRQQRPSTSRSLIATTAIIRTKMSSTQDNDITMATPEATAAINVETTTPTATSTPAVAGETDTPATVTAADTTAEADSTTTESAAKRMRPKIEKEDTSSYMGQKRSKVRGNIRGADKYKGKREGGWAAGTRNAEDAAKAAALAASGETSAEQTSTAADDGEEKEARIPKRKVALMMGYCGTGYQGMQV